MRPLRLRLEAFGPFVATQEVDFDQLGAHGLFLIHGPTGSGKSTLLDGMAYALFDARTVERGGVDFVSTLDARAETKIVFEFELRGGRYRVTRRPAQRRPYKRGEGFRDAPADATLERLDDRGQPIETLADKPTDVSKQIGALLGCTAEQFRQTVVLPQGAFREVVTDTDKSRRKVLSRVFDTGRFAQLTERLKDAASRLSQAAAQLQQQRGELLERAGAANRAELDRHAQEAGNARSEAEKERTAKHEALSKADAAQQAGIGLQERFAALEKHRVTLGDLERQRERMAQERERLEAARRASNALERRLARDRARDDHAKAVERHEQALEAVALAQERFENAKNAVAKEEERAEERERLDREVRDLEAVEARVRSVAKAQRELAEKTDAIRELQQYQERLAKSVGKGEERRATLRTEREGLLETAADLKAAQDEERRLAALVDDAGAVSQRETRLVAIAEERRELERAPEGTSELEGGTLLDVLQHHAAGLLAAHLAPGGPCPVCGSRDHPAPHDAADVDALREALDRYQQVRERLAQLDAEAVRVREELDALLGKHEWSRDGRPAVEELERQRAEAGERVAAAESAQTRLREIQEELDGLAASLEANAKDQANAKERLAELRAGVKALEDRIAEVHALLPEELRDVAAFDARLGEARRLLQERTDALDEAKEERNQASSQLGTTEAQRDERALAVTSCEKQLARAEEELAERLREHGFADEDALRAAELEPKELERRTNELKEYDEALIQARTQVKTLADELKDREPPDLEALAAKHEAAQRAWQAADEAFREASQRASKLADTLGEFDAVEGRYEQQRKRLEATQKLAALAGGSLAGRAKIDFETFVLQAIFRQVLSVGNEHLRRMTAGRYTLHLVRDEGQASSRGLELEVADNHAGGARRPAKTLSGGEGFLAALALALGLSECAQRHSGGIELGALFVDEGFGSLDDVALENVVRILQSLPQAENRMVGVITHVAELKRRIPTQVLVEPQDVGSRISIRRNA